MRTSDISDEFKDVQFTWATPKCYASSVNEVPIFLTRGSNHAYVLQTGVFVVANLMQAGELYRHDDELLDRFPARIFNLENSAIQKSANFLVPYVGAEIAQKISRLALNGCIEPVYGTLTY